MSSLDLPAYFKGEKVRKKVHTAFMPFLVSGLSRRRYRLSKTFQTLSLCVFIEASIKKLGQLISPTNLTFIPLSVPELGFLTEVPIMYSCFGPAVVISSHAEWTDSFQSTHCRTEDICYFENCKDFRSFRPECI